MKFVGIVGTNAKYSYSRELLKFVQKKYKNKFELEILEIQDIPIFTQDGSWKDHFQLRLLNNKITRADAVLISTVEYNHTISPALKSVIEWLSFEVHPFDAKPVMILGASEDLQGTSRAQIHLRGILESPGLNAFTFPGSEFLLGNAKAAFDYEGKLVDETAMTFLDKNMESFLKYVQALSGLKKEKPIEPEDLDVTSQISTTVKGVDPDDPEWVEKVAELTGAVSGDTYVKLDHGILTVDQINMFLKSMPFELTYADDNNQFLYYNNAHQDPDSMLAKRVPEQSGNRLSTVHQTLSPKQMKNVEYVINTLRQGNEEYIRIRVPNPDSSIINTHHYQAMYYDDGSYAGVNEIVFNLKPWLDWYLKATGQRLVGGTDATTSASQSTSTDTDATSGASEH